MLHRRRPRTAIQRYGRRVERLEVGEEVDEHADHSSGDAGGHLGDLSLCRQSLDPTAGPTGWPPPGRDQPQRRRAGCLVPRPRWAITWKLWLTFSPDPCHTRIGCRRAPRRRLESFDRQSDDRRRLCLLPATWLLNLHVASRLSRARKRKYSAASAAATNNRPVRTCMSADHEQSAEESCHKRWHRQRQQHLSVDGGPSDAIAMSHNQPRRCSARAPWRAFRSRETLRTP